MIGHVITLVYHTDSTKSPEEAAKEFVEAMRSGEEMDFSIEDENGAEQSFNTSDFD